MSIYRTCVRSRFHQLTPLSVKVATEKHSNLCSIFTIRTRATRPDACHTGHPSRWASLVDMPAAPTPHRPPEHSGVARVRARLTALGCDPEIRALSAGARSATDAAAALDVPVAAIASSIVFGVARGTATSDPPMQDPPLTPLLVITSGAHRVDTVRVAAALDLDSLHRVNADFVRTWSGFAIGGVAPVGWAPTEQQPGPPSTKDLALTFQPPTLVDVSLSRQQTLWAAAGHPNYVFRTTYAELLRITGGEAVEVD